MTRPFSSFFDIYTDDITMAGQHIFYFDFSMDNYPSITNSMVVPCTVYELIEPATPLESIEYTVGQGIYSFEMGLYYVAPDDSYTKIKYAVTSGGFQPTWISLTEDLDVLKFEINTELTEDSGDYDMTFTATATHSKSSVSSELAQYFTVKIVWEAEVVVNFPPYWTEGVPNSHALISGEEFSYTLPAYTDDEGDDITLTVNLGTAVLFL